jgi:hypothetical protein
MFDLFRIYRHHQRVEREALDEVQHLRRRHGAAALVAARLKLKSGDLTQWGRRVMKRAVRLLEKEQ